MTNLRRWIGGEPGWWLTGCMSQGSASRSSGTLDPTQTAFRALNRLATPAIKAGVGSPLPTGLGTVVLESRGRVSGKRREVPLVGFRLGDRVLVSTVRNRSQWLRNLEADERAAVWYCGRRHEATATVERGPLNLVTLDITG